VPVGRPNPSHIRGITNALDTSDSLAASNLSLDAVLALKATRKVQLQKLYGLSAGQQYSLATFVGRMTQQKGCDITAEVAETLMARYPLLQLVVVGPSGD
jgi:glycogen synthase